MLHHYPILLCLFCSHFVFRINSIDCLIDLHSVWQVDIHLFVLYHLINGNDFDNYLYILYYMSCVDSGRNSN